MSPEGAAAQGAPGGGGGRGGDRLGALPDRILFRVMRHLKAWEVVRTSMLSRRWRDLWATTSHLDIRRPCTCGYPGHASRLDTRHPCRCGYPGHVHGWTLEFAKFVKNLLLRRQPLALLDSFRLCWSHKADDGDANTWIAYAVRHGAQEIELSGVHHMVYPSPEYMSFIVAGDELAKNRLRILKLIHIQLDRTTLTQLCSKCVYLEELELKDCVIPHKTKIGPILLARLTMIRCQIKKGLSVHAPNLVELQFNRNLWHVPWIQNLGLLAASNINQQAPHKYLEGSSLGSCNLKILKLSRVILDDTTLAQLCSRCTSLEELELNGCSVVGKEIRSNSLRCLTMINCKFSIGSGVRAPNLLSLRCIRPFQQVPQFWNMEFLATSIISLDDSCMPSESWWTWTEDDKDEPYLNDSIAVHSGAEDLDDNRGSSGPADEVDGCTVCYEEIADKYNGACGGKFGGAGLLCSLSNVRTLELSAHSGEVLLMRESKLCTNFRNLRTLSLGEWCITADLDVLASMLQSSPNLENLFVHLDMANKIRVGFNPEASSFTCTNLKKVEITCCKHDDMLPILAKLFHVNGIAHEKIFVRRTTCTCAAKRNAGSKAKRKAQTESEKRPEKQIKPANHI